MPNKIVHAMIEDLQVLRRHWEARIALLDKASGLLLACNADASGKSLSAPIRPIPSKERGIPQKGKTFGGSSARRERQCTRCHINKRTNVIAGVFVCDDCKGKKIRAKGPLRFRLKDPGGSSVAIPSQSHKPLNDDES